MLTKMIEKRESLNLTQEQVANYLGITRAAYCNYERGTRKPPLVSIVKLKTLFKTKDDSIFLPDNETDCTVKTA